MRVPATTTRRVLATGMLTALLGSGAALATAAPASAHVPGVKVGPVAAGCSDASVQPVRRNARGQVVEQYVLRATLTSPKAHTHVVDRQLRVANRHTGRLSAWRTVQVNRNIACGKGSGTSAISGTTNLAGVAWKVRTVDTSASATSLTLPPAALENGNAPSKNKNAGDPGTPIVVLGHDWT